MESQTFAETLRLQMEAAQQEQQAARVAQANKEKENAEALQEQERKNALGMFQEAKETINKKSHDGEKTTRISIMDAGRDPYPDWARYRANFLKELLEKEGLTVQVATPSHDSAGTYEYYGHPVYDLYLHVSW